MEKQPATAALRFVAQDESLYGTVTSMSAKDINVRLHSPPVSNELFATGTGAGLIVLARDTMFSTATEVAAEHDGVVRLLFTAGVRTVQRRRHSRVAIELGVSFRLVQEDGCFSSWRSGFGTDISSGGICLVIATGFETPRNIEMLFMLPDLSPESQIGGAVGAHADIELLRLVAANRPATLRTPNKERPLKTNARVCNHRILPDGQSALGLAFTTLSPGDQIRLARFLNAPWHPFG